MLGQIKLEQFKALEEMPQRYQSAWDGVEWEKFTGAKYNPLLCAGEQLVNGRNFYYVAEQVLSDVAGTRHLVLLGVHEHDGQYYLNREFKVIL